jgi:hypothetical protein
MTKILFTVFDSAAKAYMEPFFAPTVEFAIRKFRATVNEPGTTIHRFPEDYSLFAIGEFDPETGMVKPYQELHSLGVAIQFVDRPELVAQEVASA